jgi:hypothetical protein
MHQKKSAPSQRDLLSKRIYQTLLQKNRQRQISTAFTLIELALEVADTAINDGWNPYAKIQDLKLTWSNDTSFDMDEVWIWEDAFVPGEN